MIMIEWRKMRSILAHRARSRANRVVLIIDDDVWCSIHSFLSLIDDNWSFVQHGTVHENASALLAAAAAGTAQPQWPTLYFISITISFVNFSFHSTFHNVLAALCVTIHLPCTRVYPPTHGQTTGAGLEQEKKNTKKKRKDGNCIGSMAPVTVSLIRCFVFVILHHFRFHLPFSFIVCSLFGPFERQNNNENEQNWSFFFSFIIFVVVWLVRAIGRMWWIHTFTCCAGTHAFSFSHHHQYTMLRAIIQEVFMRATTFAAAVHNYVVNWMQKWPLVIWKWVPQRPRHHQSMNSVCDR